MCLENWKEVNVLLCYSILKTAREKFLSVIWGFSDFCEWVFGFLFKFLLYFTGWTRENRWSFLILPSVTSVKPGDLFGLFFYSAAAKNFWQATFGLRNFSKLSKKSDCIKKSIIYVRFLPTGSYKAIRNTLFEACEPVEVLYKCCLMINSSHAQK